MHRNVAEPLSLSVEEAAVARHPGLFRSWNDALVKSLLIGLSSIMHPRRGGLLGLPVRGRHVSQRARQSMRDRHETHAPKFLSSAASARHLLRSLGPTTESMASIRSFGKVI